MKCKNCKNGICDACRMRQEINANVKYAIECTDFLTGKYGKLGEVEYKYIAVELNRCLQNINAATKAIKGVYKDVPLLEQKKIDQLELIDKSLQAGIILNNKDKI